MHPHISRHPRGASPLRIGIGGLLALVLVVAASPFAFAQPSAATGRILTDFERVLSVDGFDSSRGQLVAADVSLSAALDSRVLEITNHSANAANFSVTTSVQFCGGIGGTVTSYVSCAASASPTLKFQTGVLAESFVNLAAGASASSQQPATASDIASLRVLDPAQLSDFVDARSVDIGVATLAGFEALGGGGNSLVEIETYASVSAQVNYIYAGVSLNKLTNGEDGGLVDPGDDLLWSYDVTNDGNTALQNVVVTDDKEGQICTIVLLEAGTTHRCTNQGTASEAAYSNIGSVVAEPVINPGITVEDDDESSYVLRAPTPTPTAVTTSPTPTPLAPVPAPTPTQTRPPPATPTLVVPVPDSGPRIDIELSTNGIDADTAPGVQLDVHQPIIWTYIVTNTGVIDLYNVVVTDDLAGNVCQSSHVPSGGQTSCALQGVASVGDFRRVGTVIGQSSTGQGVSDVDPTHHVVSEEVLGKVVTPPPLPGRPLAPLVPRLTTISTPDEVLARTGTDSDVRTTVGVLFLGSGSSLLALSTGLRRRKN